MAHEGDCFPNQEYNRVGQVEHGMIGQNASVKERITGTKPEMANNLVGPVGALLTHQADGLTSSGIFGFNEFPPLQTGSRYSIFDYRR